MLLPVTEINRILPPCASPEELAALHHWQQGMEKALLRFLQQIKTEIVEHYHVVLPSLLVSYAPAVPADEQLTIETVVEQIKTTLASVNILVTSEPLSTAEALEQQLASSTLAIVLCTPAYATATEQEPRIRQVLDAFGSHAKDALHALLCEGDWKGTAFKIVDKRYLIRDYKGVVELTGDALLPVQRFIDVFTDVSGTQGLGILPDVLGLAKNHYSEARSHYHALWLSLQQTGQQLTLDYRLQADLVAQHESHPLRELLVAESLPAVGSFIQSLLDDELAKTSLLLGATTADTVLIGLALEHELLQRSQRVLSINCSDYPGKAAAHCVRLVLQALKIKSHTEQQALQQAPMILLLKGYEQLGVYDNLYLKNQLNRWPQIKLLVTCRADFFQHRGYANCFLTDPANPQLSSLQVPLLQAFASKEAQQRCLSLNAPAVTLVAPALELPTSKRQAQQVELTTFLENLQGWLIEQGVIKANSAQNPQIFISYAWETGEALLRLQNHLRRLVQDLSTLGFPVWLDIERMTGDIDKQMAGNIADSRFALVIGTPQYSKRVEEKNSNAQKEYLAILEKEKTGQLTVLPLQFTDQALPPNLQTHPLKADLRGIDAFESYVRVLIQDLIPRLLALTIEQQEAYNTHLAQLQQQLTLLPGKHLLVEHGQDAVQAHDIDHRLEGYIIPHGLSRADAPLDTRFDLQHRFQQFLSSGKKTCVVFGGAGAGKSLFALSTLKTLLQDWHGYRQFSKEPKPLPAWLPVYIPLKYHAHNKAETCIANTLKGYGLEEIDITALKNGLGQGQRFLFILDGYDELGRSVQPNLPQQLSDWPTAKVLITSRPEHFDNESQYTAAFAQRTDGGHLDANSFEQYAVSPFLPTEITRYVEHYHKGDEEKVQGTLQKLHALPGLMDLLATPFLLNLVLQALPFLKLGSHYQTITRTDIYQAFLNCGFSKEDYKRGVSEKELWQFARTLAFAMFDEQTLTVTQAHQTLWKTFFTEDQAVLRGACPLRRTGENQYAWVHKSVQEFLVADYLWTVLVTNDFSPAHLDWNKRLLTVEPAVIAFLADKYRRAEASSKAHAHLLSVLEASKETAQVEVAAANAITVLNHARFPFSGMDLSGIRIPGADLSEGLLDHTDLTDADLRQVNFARAFLRGTRLLGSILTDGEGRDAFFDSHQGRELGKGTVHSQGNVLLLIDSLAKEMRHYDRTIRQWLGLPIQIRVPEDEDLKANITFTPDSRLAFLSYSDRHKGSNEVQIYDVAKRQLLPESLLAPAGKKINQIEISGDGCWAFLYNTSEYNDNSQVQVYDVANQQLLPEPLTAPAGKKINQIALSADSRWAFLYDSHEGSHAVQAYDVVKQQLLPEPLTAPVGETINRITFSADSRLAFLYYQRRSSADNRGGNQAVQVYDMAKQPLLLEPLTAPVGEKINQITLSADNRWAFLYYWDWHKHQASQAVQIYDLANRQLLPELLPAPAGGEITQIKISADSRWAFLYESGGRRHGGSQAVQVYDVAKRELLPEPLIAPTGEKITEIEISVDSRWAFLYHSDTYYGKGGQAVQVYDVANRQLLPELIPAHLEEKINRVKISADSRWAFLDSRKGSQAIQIYDCQNRKRCPTLQFEQAIRGINIQHPSLWLFYSDLHCYIYNLATQETSLLRQMKGKIEQIDYLGNDEWVIQSAEGNYHCWGGEKLTLHKTTQTPTAINSLTDIREITQLDEFSYGIISNYSAYVGQIHLLNFPVLALSKLTGIKEDISTIAVSADRRWAFLYCTPISGKDSLTARIYDVANRQLLPDIMRAAVGEKITSVQVSADSRWAFFYNANEYNNNGTIQVYDLAKRQLTLAPLTALPGEKINRIAISADSRWAFLYNASERDNNSQVQVYDVASQQLLPESLAAPAGEKINRITLSADSRWAFLYDSKGSQAVQVYDIAGQQLLPELLLASEGETINQIEISADSRLAFLYRSHEGSRMVQVYDLANRQLLPEPLPALAGEIINQIKISADGRLAFLYYRKMSSSDNRSGSKVVQVYDVANRQLLLEPLPALAGETISEITLSTDSRWAFLYSNLDRLLHSQGSKVVQVYDVANRQLLLEPLSAPQGEEIHGVALSKDSRWALLRGRNCLLMSYDIQQKYSQDISRINCSRFLELSTSLKADLQKPSSMPALLLYGEGGSFILLSNGEMVTLLKDIHIQKALLLNNGTGLLTVDKDSTCRLWDISHLNHPLLKGCTQGTTFYVQDAQFDATTSLSKDNQQLLESRGACRIEQGKIGSSVPAQAILPVIVSESDLADVKIELLQHLYQDQCESGHQLLRKYPILLEEPLQEQETLARLSVSQGSRAWRIMVAKELQAALQTYFQPYTIDWEIIRLKAISEGLMALQQNSSDEELQMIITTCQTVVGNNLPNLIQQQQYDLVKLVLSQSVPVDSVNASDETALYLAARQGQQELVELLVLQGANVNAKSNHSTVLHQAIISGEFAIVRYLVPGRKPLIF